MRSAPPDVPSARRLPEPPCYDAGAVLGATQHRASSEMAASPIHPRVDLTAFLDVVFPKGQDPPADLRAIALNALRECGSLEELVDALVVRLTQTDVPPSPECVRILSLHKSKGLASPVVFVAGLVDGVVPTLVTGLSEERTESVVAAQQRLLYVAPTRASEQPALT